MNDYSLLLFPSSHDAIRTEKLLRDRFAVTMMPTPRRYSTSCGLCLRFCAADQAAVLAALDGQAVRFQLVAAGAEPSA